MPILPRSIYSATTEREREQIGNVKTANFTSPLAQAASNSACEIDHPGCEKEKARPAVPGFLLLRTVPPQMSSRDFAKQRKR